MENEQKGSGAAKALGIVSLVLGILTAVVSFIPCFGMYAVFIGAVALLFGAIGLFLASKSPGTSKGLLIAGIVCAAVGTGIGAFQYIALKKGADKMQEMAKDGTLDSLGKEAFDKINEAGDSLKENVEEGVEQEIKNATESN